MSYKGRTKSDIRSAGELMRRFSDTHKSWTQMRSRCHDPNNDAYPRYGGRGITICDRWSIFENFLADMGVRPSRNHSLDRVDSDGNYEPENCKWSTPLEQTLNRRMMGNNKSGFRGVSWRRREQRWYAQISLQYRVIHIAISNDKEEAAWMYDQWALELHGDLAQLNFEYI